MYIKKTNILKRQKKILDNKKQNKFIFLKKKETKKKIFFFKYLIKLTTNYIKNKEIIINKKIENIIINYQILIKFSISNIIFNLTNINGNNIISTSSGVLKYSSSQKKNKHALLNILNNLKNENNLNFLKNKKIILYISGHIKRFNSLIIKHLKKNYNIAAIKLKTRLPHNGCKPRKLKRLKKFFFNIN